MLNTRFIIMHISIGVELELQGIALQRCRIDIGILLLFCKRQELVLVFYWSNKKMLELVL
jgi:hypothetical protein